MGDARAEDERTQTAIHEAGHAVMARHFGVAMDQVTIDASEAADGGVSLGPGTLPPGFDFSAVYGPEDVESRALIETLVLIKLAGAVAVELAGLDPVGCETDDEQVWRLAKTVTYTDDEAGAFVAWLRLRALALLAIPANRQAHAALVAALLDQPTMTGRDALTVMAAGIVRATLDTSCSESSGSAE